MERNQPETTRPTRRDVLAMTAVGAGIGAGICAAPAAAAPVAEPMINGLVEVRAFEGMGMACLEFNINDMLAQGELVCDIFVATGSDSPIILATGGAIGSATVSPWHTTHHVSVILCQPYTQHGARGVRLRINFVGDNPERNLTQRISLLQAGARYFTAPERTVGVPQ